MDPELKAALDALNMNLNQAIEAQNKAVDELRKTAEENAKKRDAAYDEKIANLEKELDKFEVLNKAIQAAEAREKEIQESVERIEASLSRPGNQRSEEDAKAAEYHDSFFAWVRRDKEAFIGDKHKNVLQVGDDSSAGYLAPAEFVREILKGIVEYSPMRGLVTVRRTSKSAIQMPRRLGKPAWSWVGETQKRPDAGSNSYGLDKIEIHEGNFRTFVTSQMLEDSEFDIEQEMREAVIEGLSEVEGEVILTGDGHNKPRGLLNGPDYIQFKSGLAADITADNVVGLKYAVKTGYARNGSYILNRKTLGKIRVMKDGNGQYLWAPGLADGRPNTIDGSPYAEMPDMPDVGAGTKPIAFGDWKKAYTLVDRIDLQVLRDQYTMADQGQIVFNWRRRFGGDVRLGEAYAVLSVEV